MVGLENPLHLAILLLIVLLIFGAKRLPEMGRSLGAGMRGFKESITGEAKPEPPTELPAGVEGAAAGPAERADARPAA